MRKYIRFKVKHLLAFIGSILAIVIASYFFLPSVLLAIADDYYDKGELETAKVYYERINKFFPSSRSTPEALERAAQLAMHDNMLMVSPMGIGTPPETINVLSEEVQRYYQELAKSFPDTFQGKRAITELTIHDINNKINNGEINEAVSLVKEYYDADKSRINSNVAMTAAKEFNMRGYYQEGIDTLEFYILKSESKYLNAYELLGELYVTVGNAEKAEYYYAEVLAHYKDMKERQRELMEEDPEIAENIDIVYYDERVLELGNKINELSNLNEQSPSTGKGSVSGTIMLSGEPLNNVKMLLEPLPNPHEYTSGTPGATWGISNDKGEFIFENIVPGRYGLGFVINLDQVGDVVLKGGTFPKSIFFVEEGLTQNWDFKLVETMRVLSPVDGEIIQGDFIEFSWEPFEEAAYYQLELGIYMGAGNQSSIIPGKYYENKAVLNIEELRYIPTGTSYNADGLVPMSLFGYAVPGGKYFWGVKAYDEDGKEITASRGYLKNQNTDFAFPEKDMLEADQLLFDRKFKEAVAAYEQILEDEPNHIHALLMLGKLYQVSIPEEIGDYNMTDSDKSLAYYKRLYELTGEVSILDSINSLYYYSLKDYENSLKTLKEIENQKDLNDWEKVMYARLESYFGNYDYGMKNLLRTNERFYTEEAALRIITENLHGITVKNKNDANEIKWVKAMEEYMESYKNEDQALKNEIKNKSITDAITFLDNQELNAHGEFLKLSLKLLDPSLSSDTTKNIQEFTEKYAANEPKLTKIAQGLFQY